jgi:protein TonB
MRRLFEELLDSAARRTRRRGLFLPLSAAAHLLIVGAVVAVSVLAPPTLPESQRRILRIADLSSVVEAATPRPPVAVHPPRGGSGGPAPRGKPFVAPMNDPGTIPNVNTDPTLEEPVSSQGPCLGCAPAGPDVGPPGAGGGPESQEGAGGGPRVVRVGTVQPPRKLKDVKPRYPGLAVASRLEGSVVIECTIGTDGRVAALKVLKGVPILEAAAVDAVRQWIYSPTLLDGVPVAVIMTVTVTFTIPH